MDDFIAFSTGQAMDQFPDKIGQSIGFDKKCAGDDQREQESDETCPETAHPSKNCHAQFRQGFPVGYDDRFQVLGGQQPLFRYSFANQGPSCNRRGGGRDHEGLVLELGDQAFYPLNHRFDQPGGWQQQYDKEQ
jgi:hypothetical protein